MGATQNEKLQAFKGQLLHVRKKKLKPPNRQFYLFLKFLPEDY